MPQCIAKQMMRYGILFPTSNRLIYVCTGVWRCLSVCPARDAWVGCLSSKPISRNAPIKIKIKAKSYMTTTTTQSRGKSRVTSSGRKKPVPDSRVFALRSTAKAQPMEFLARRESQVASIGYKTFQYFSTSPFPCYSSPHRFTASVRRVHLEK